MGQNKENVVPHQWEELALKQGRLLSLRNPKTAAYGLVTEKIRLGRFYFTNSSLFGLKYINIYYSNLFYYISQLICDTKSFICNL